MSTPTRDRRVELVIGGMTCASCANRIERKLNGSTASPPRSTTPPRRPGSPRPAGVGPTELIATVEAAGYTAALPAPAARTGRAGADDPTRRPARPRCSVAAALAAAGRRAGDGPGAAVPLLAVDLAGAGRAGRGVGRRGRSTGPPGRTCATARPRWTRSSRWACWPAFGWSLYALLFGTAGEPGMTHPFELTVAPLGRQRQHLPRGRRRGHRVHPGRPLRSRPGPSGGPGRRCGRCWSWARRTSPCCRGRRARRRVPVEPAGASATGSSCGPARRSPPTASVVEGTSAVDASMLTGESVPVEVGPGDAVVGGHA